MGKPARRAVLAATAAALVVAAAGQYDSSPIDDISPNGVCATAVKNHCSDVTAGAAAVYDCLKNALKAQKNSKVEESKMILAPCKREIRDFKVDRSKSFVLDTKLYNECEDDATKLCATVPQRAGSVLACLRSNKKQLNSKCQKQVFERQEEAAADFKADAELDEKCSADATALCEGVEAGEGRVQACLRGKRASISWECQEELFRQEVENAGDFRLNYELRKACTTDAKEFCKDIKPGNARIKNCLEANLEKPSMSGTCKASLEKMMARRSSDFRLDTKVRTLCASDIEDVCGYEKDSLDSVAGYDGRVGECLQDYKEELLNPDCKAAVRQITLRASKDIRMDKPLWDACVDDRAQLCSDVPPGSSRVIRCLQDNRIRLSFECRATLFDEEMRFAEDIDFKHPMKKACTDEIARFCKGVEQGHARVIGCLHDHDKEADMSAECRAEVKRDEIRAAQDFRLNARLSRSCDADIDGLCSDACALFGGQACGGTVLRCLQAKQANVTKPECKKEIFNIERGEVDDWRRDAILSAACSGDVSKLCADVKAGGGAVHRCLRDHAADLSDECKAEELNLATIQSKDVRLMPQLEAQCKGEIAAFCKGVPPGGQRVLRCLQTNLKAADMGTKCADQVDKWAQRSARNYKLDYGISKLCSGDIGSLCPGVESMGRSNIIKCLSNSFNQTSVSCQHEVGRAVKLAMMLYHKGAPLTADCDGDAEALCPSTAPVQRSKFSKQHIGSSYKCLTKKVKEGSTPPVSERCSTLVRISNDATVAPAKGSSAKQVAREVVNIEKKETSKKGGAAPGALVLTGWVALAAVFALVVVIIGLVIFVVRKYRSGSSATYAPLTTAVKDGGA